MPANVALDLTPDELADVVAFLRSKPAQESLKQGPRRIDRALAIGPFAARDGPPPCPARPARPVQTAARDRTARSDGPGSPARRAASRARSTSEGEIRTAKPGRAYLAVRGPIGQREQTAAIRFGIEGAASRIYLNGSKVADVPERDPIGPGVSSFGRPRASSTCLAPLPDLARLATLKAGWQPPDRSPSTATDDNPGDVTGRASKSPRPSRSRSGIRRMGPRAPAE